MYISLENLSPFTYELSPMYSECIEKETPKTIFKKTIANGGMCVCQWTISHVHGFKTHNEINNLEVGSMKLCPISA